MTSAAAFSVREIPFSCFGSWLDLSCVIAENTVADDVHLVSHRNGFHPVLRLVPLAAGAPAGGRAATRVEATPARLRWGGADGLDGLDGSIEAAFAATDTLRIAGRGLGLSLEGVDPVLTPFSGCYFFADPTSGAWVMTCYETGQRYRITVLSGAVRTVGEQALGRSERAVRVGVDGRPWEVVVEEFGSTRAPYRGLPSSELSFEQVVASAADGFAGFLDAVAPWRDADTPAAELAGYVLWSAAVSPAGFLSRPAVLMSKHWMDKVWSWDHCFNALALAGLPALAWDQFRLVFDHQDDAGALPDSVAHSEVLRNFVKPPVHGWALHRLRRAAGDLATDELLDVYRRVGRWTRFWLDGRRAQGSELAHYQHGNDSGWDNATTFGPERVVESADLAALLVLQLRELARLAADLGRPADAEGWQSAADRMLAALLDRLWTGERFVAQSPLSGRTWTSDSLLDLVPIVLGEELPEPVASALAARIAEHLTEHGPATELPTSAHYRADGYWRGPVWAPSTLLVEDGLRRAGHVGLADEVSRRFRALCEASGFAENFDALTGAGLRDRAYTWTASGYLVLAADHVRRREEAPAVRKPRA